MAKHTRFPTFEALCAAAGIHTAEEFEACPDDQWETHIRASTPFRSWEEMQQAAGQEWMLRRLEG